MYLFLNESRLGALFYRFWKVVPYFRPRDSVLGIISRFGFGTLEPGHTKTRLMPHVNNKGADQFAHPHSLISTFVVCCLDSIMYILAISKVSRLASFCSCAGWFECYLVKNPRRHIFV